MQPADPTADKAAENAADNAADNAAEPDEHNQYTAEYTAEGTFPDAAALDAALDAFLDRWAVLSPATVPAFAERTAAWLGLPPHPRFADSVLPRLGIRIERQGLPPGIWAVWSVDEGLYRICISPFLSAPRANFTLWHEWFEIMAARPAFPRHAPALMRQHDGHARRAGSLSESLADRFAACITMPSGAVLLLLQELGASGDKTDVIASRLGVSISAMRRRIRELGLARLTFNHGEPRLPPQRRTDGSRPEGQ